MRNFCVSATAVMCVAVVGVFAGVGFAYMRIMTEAIGAEGTANTAYWLLAVGAVAVAGVMVAAILALGNIVNTIMHKVL